MAAKAVRMYNHPCIVTVRNKCKTLFSQKYLLYTNTAISMLMSCTGDGLQQNYQIAKKEIASWDKRRSRDVAVTGFLIGPFCHYWYIFLDRWLPGRSVRVVSKKLIVDQLICSPIVITSFLSVTSYLEGKRGKELKNELIEKGKILYTAEWIVWPPAQIINFCFLPTKYRVLFDNSVSFVFDWYFSSVKYGNYEDSNEIAAEIADNLESQEDRAVDINLYGSHVPFLHIQAADSIQSRLDHIDWDNWSDWFYRGHHERDWIKDITETNLVDETDSESNEACLKVTESYVNNIKKI